MTITRAISPRKRRMYFMFKTIKRIIDWCGEFKGKLYGGFVMTFFSHFFTAMPLMLAAYTIGLFAEAQKNKTMVDSS